MKFNFTPEELAEGKVVYTLPDFRRELRQQIKDFIMENNPPQSPPDIEKLVDYLLHLQFDVYYWTAIENDLEDLVEFFKENDPETKISLPMLQALAAEGVDNIKVLRTILRQKTIEFMKNGLTDEAAAASLSDYIKECLQQETAIIEPPPANPQIAP